MGRLLKLSHPHHIDKIDNTRKLLLTYRNLLIELYNKGFVEKIDGVNLPIRFNLKTESFVIDREEKNYPLGVNLSNIDVAYINKNALREGGKKLLSCLNQQGFIEFSKKYNLNKNPNRFLFFEYVNNKTNIIEYESEEIFLVGLYLKKESKKYIPVDTSKNFINQFANKFSFISNINTGKLKESHYDFFDKMITKVKKESLDIIIDNQKINLKMLDYLNSNHSFNKIHVIKNKKIKDTSINLYRNVINNNINLNLNEFNKIKNGFLATHLNLTFGNYIKEKLDLLGEGLIVNTGLFNKTNVKITGDFILKNNESNFYQDKDKKDINENYKPILPFKF